MPTVNEAARCGAAGGHKGLLLSQDCFEISRGDGDRATAADCAAVVTPMICYIKLRFSA